MAARNPSEFLNSVLLYPGPSELPYAEQDKWTIREHILELVQVWIGGGQRWRNFPHRYSAAGSHEAIPRVITYSQQHVQR